MMDGSHWSCSKGYKCSSTELDTLTDVARDSGAFGSRLTGAGWGGCTVSLIHQNDETEFLKKGRVKNSLRHSQREFIFPCFENKMIATNSEK